MEESKTSRRDRGAWRGFAFPFPHTIRPTATVTDSSVFPWLGDSLILPVMADQEIDVIRAILLANPRPEELSERRKRLDDLGARYKIASEQSLLAVSWRLPLSKNPGALLILNSADEQPGKMRLFLDDKTSPQLCRTPVWCPRMNVQTNTVLEPTAAPLLGSTR